MTFGQAAVSVKSASLTELAHWTSSRAVPTVTFHAMRTLLRTSLFASCTILVAAVAGCSKDSGNDETTSPGGGNNNQPAYNIADFTASGQKNDRHVGHVAQAFAHFPTVHIWHHNIQ